MAARTQNPYIDFYGRHGISPVHQDISDFKVHMMRREKLYRMLGLPPIAFSGKTVLEIGPGGGYNSLVSFVWGVRKLCLLEPNRKACEEIPVLFDKYGVDRKRWTLSRCKAEKFMPGCEYDIVIAEGFIPGLRSKDDVIAKISNLVKRGGAAVVTCVDELSFLLELIRRLVAARLVQRYGIDDFNRKVAVLSAAFRSHLKSLKFASRPIEDWVADQLLSPALYSEFFSIADCIGKFGDEFALLGSSPSMFTDYSWYKDIAFDSRSEILDQFYSKRHLLISSTLAESERPARDNDALVSMVRRLHDFAKKSESSMTKTAVNALVRMLKEINLSARDIDTDVSKAIEEGIVLLQDDAINESKISSSGNLASAFGRGQQYVSLVKKYTG